MKTKVRAIKIMRDEDKRELLLVAVQKDGVVKKEAVEKPDSQSYASAIAAIEKAADE